MIFVIIKIKSMTLRAWCFIETNLKTGVQFTTDQSQQISHINLVKLVNLDQ